MILILDNGVERPATPEEAAEITSRRSPDLQPLKTAKNDEINTWRALANLTTFPHLSKQVACDQVSRSDIDAVANHIALFGTFTPDFPGAWKATDNTYLPMVEIEQFKAMYQSMAAQGTANFNHAQALKLQLALADTADEIVSIEW